MARPPLSGLRVLDLAGLRSGSMNEVLADGHAVWTDYDTSNRRTHWVGNAGGASGAQLIIATDR
mgnify:CR=1 FL=1